MVEDEQARQQHEISGEEFLFCDRCGKPLERSGARLIERTQSPEAELVEDVWLCADCLQAIEKGEAEVEIGSELEEPE